MVKPWERVLVSAPADKITVFQGGIFKNMDEKKIYGKNIY